jgi:ECF transporter S component (folate family)
MELKNLIVLVTTAMLTALNTVLGLFTVMVGNFIKISFSYLTIGLTGMLYGPVPAGILGGAGDIINYLIKPTGAFFPGFTLNGIITGFIYGLFFYKQTISFKRVFLAKLCVVLLVDLCLSTTWLSMLYGKGFLVLLPMRAVKAAILLPFESGLLYFLLTRITLILKNISSQTPQTQVKD